MEFIRPKLARQLPRVVVLLFLLGLSASPARALPFGSFSPRAQAMGGAVVAAGTASDAAFANPALLGAAAEHGHFALAVPILTVETANARNFRNKLDDVQSAYDQVRATFPACATGSCTAQQKAAAIAALDTLNGRLAAISGEPVEGDLFGGISIGIPGHEAGIALFADSRVVGDAQANYDSRDQQNILAAITAIQNGLAPPVDPSSPGNIYSNAVFRGAVVSEVGLALAHRFARADGGGLSVGFAPKLQRVQTIDYTESIDTASFGRNTGRSYTGANLDAGVVEQLGRHWRVGLVGKDLVSHTYRTAAGNRIRLRPSYRAGIARSGDWLTLAADYDLSTNRPIGGLGGDTRFLSLGAEFNVLDTLQLRVGVRDNTATSRTFKHAVTAGFGLRILGAHVDLAAMKGGRELGAAMQAGVSF